MLLYRIRFSLFFVLRQKTNTVEDPAHDESGNRHGSRVRAVMADETGSK